MQAHPVEGAKMIIESGRRLDLAAAVAHEHHIMINGHGYPTHHYRRDCHKASNLVHVCDVYDALRTKRPYRDAWEAERVLTYISERAGTEFEPSAANSFVNMMRRVEGGIQRSSMPPANGSEPSASQPENKPDPAAGAAPGAPVGAAPGAPPPPPGGTP
jgi:putative two-component system response regulator